MSKASGRDFINIKGKLAQDLDLNLNQLEIQTDRPTITEDLRQNVIDATLTTNVPQSNADSCEWVNRGNQQ